MSFLNLWAFWITAAVVPALLILYFLKLRRREEAVSSTLLWKRAVQDLQVNAPFQKLRKNLLLFLQLLLLAAGIFALARPIVESEAAEESSLIILIDRSASMNTMEEGQTRLELAKEQAVRLVKTLNRTGSRWFTFGGAKADTRVMVITFADRAGVVSPFTTNTSDLVDLIRNITPTDARTNMREALELAEAYTMPTRKGVDNAPISPEQGSRIILFSDGRIGDLEDLVLRGGVMELRLIGKQRANVAITALRTQRNYETPEMINTFLQVRNYGPEEVTTDVSLYLDGRMVAARSITLAAVPDRAGSDPSTQPTGPTPVEGSVVSLSFPGQLDTGGVLEARLAIDDALPTDNSAQIVVPPPVKLRVLLVSKQAFFLMSALRGLPLETVDLLDPDEYENAAPDKLERDGRSLYDVVILDKHNTERLPAGAYLFFESVPLIEEISVGEPLGYHAMMWWDEAHPVLRYVGLEPVVASRGLTLQAPEEAEMLVEGPAGPVLLRYARDGRHYMILSFSVENSTWFNRPSFPIFMYNVVRYLGRGGAVAESGPIRPGDSLRIPLPAGESKTTLTRPDDTTVELTADAGGIAHYGGTHQVGTYVVSPGIEGRDRFAVNLEDESESDIAPRSFAQIGGETVEVGRTIETATPEIWRWFIAAALLIALIEWYVYNRRVMI